MPGLEGIYQRPRVESWAGKLRDNLREDRAEDDAKAQWAAKKVMEAVKTMRDSGNYSEEQIAAKAQEMLQRLPGAERYLSAGDVSLPASPLADQQYQNKMKAAEIQGQWLGGEGSPTQQQSAPMGGGGMPPMPVQQGQDGGIPTPETPPPPSGRGASQAALDNLLKIYTAISTGGDQEGARKFLDTAVGLVRSSSLPPEDQMWAERILAGTATSAGENLTASTEMFKSENALAGTQAQAGATTESARIRANADRDVAQLGIERERVSQSGQGGAGGSGIYLEERDFRILNQVDDLIGRVGPSTVGAAAWASWINGSPPADFAADLLALKGNIFAREIQAMRHDSPTGGAVGQVAVEEVKRFENSLGSLEQNQSPANMRENLQDIRESIRRYRTARSMKQQGFSDEEIMKKVYPDRFSGGADVGGRESVIDVVRDENGNFVIQR